MNKYYVLFTLIFAQTYIFSQNNSTVIAKEADLIKARGKDRETVRQYIENGDSRVADFIDKFHSYRHKSNKTYILDFNERVIVQFAAGRFEDVLEDISKNEHLKRRDTHNKSYYLPIINDDEAFIRSKAQEVISNIAQSNLGDADKEMLTLYFKSTINRLYNKIHITYFEQKEVNYQSQALIPHIKNARQKAFIHRKIINYNERHYMLGLTIDAVNSYFFMGDYATYFDNFIQPYGFSVNVVRKNIYCHVGFGSFKTSLLRDIPENEHWVAKEKVLISQYEVGLGYPFIFSDRFVIAPIVNGSVITFDLYKNYKVKTQSQTTINIGANLHFNFSPKVQRISDKLHALSLRSFFPNSIKIFVGYQPLLKKGDFGFSGGAFMLAVGIGVLEVF